MGGGVDGTSFQPPSIWQSENKLEIYKKGEHGRQTLKWNNYIVIIVLLIALKNKITALLQLLNTAKGNIIIKEVFFFTSGFLPYSLLTQQA